MFVHLFTAAPSTPPTNVFAPPLSTEEQIQVTWSSLPCDHVNSLTQIIGYEVRYRPIGANDWTLRVLNPPVNSTVIQGVVTFEIYEVQVAARNEIGLGPFSMPVMASISTRGTSKSLMLLLCVYGNVSLRNSYCMAVEVYDSIPA